MPKILVVDDDNRNIFALTLTLKAKGFQVISCFSGQDALAVLEKDPEVNVVLLDMMMPEMDGYETLKILRNTPSISTVPVISVTAQAMSGDREKCIQAGADDYISKPVDMDKLMAALNKLL